MPERGDTEKIRRAEHEQDLADAAGQADLAGALTLAEAQAMHEHMVEEAARIGAGADWLERAARLTEFLNGLAQ